jgi:hypothetical protein
MQDAEDAGIPTEDGMPLFSREHLPPTDDARWAEYQKKVATKAIRIDGPFRVETSESENEPFLCEDGYLAIDARGYPYAIATEEFELIYAPVAEPEAESPDGGSPEEGGEETPA